MDTLLPIPSAIPASFTNPLELPAHYCHFSIWDATTTANFTLWGDHISPIANIPLPFPPTLPTAIGLYIIFLNLIIVILLLAVGCLLMPDGVQHVDDHQDHGIQHVNDHQANGGVDLDRHLTEFTLLALHSNLSADAYGDLLRAKFEQLYGIDMCSECELSDSEDEDEKDNAIHFEFFARLDGDESGSDGGEDEDALDTDVTIFE
ncbi:hypothetical protein DFH27DRAFT_609917 [Peziza echinospora]|nr:hypothetical protein DFH27DRAFT_609917 [Peziza echinospora]